MSAPLNLTPAQINALTKDEFNALYKTQHGGTGDQANVGKVFKTVADAHGLKANEQVTCVRVSPKAKSCAFFMDSNNVIRYLKLGRDVALMNPQPAAPKKSTPSAT